MVVRMNLLQAFDNNILLLKIVAIWCFENEFLYKIYRYFVTSVLVLHIATMILFVVSSKDQELDVILEGTYVTVGATEALIKNALFRRNFTAITNTWHNLEKEEFQPRTDEQKMIIDDYVSSTQIVFKIFNTIVGLTGSTLIILPWLTEESDLPTNSWFPFDYHMPVLHEVIYIVISICALYFVFGNCGINLYCYISMSQIAAQCDLVADTVRNIEDISKNFNTSKLSNHESIKSTILIECVHHYNLIRK
jgi:hypothetical protein